MTNILTIDIGNTSTVAGLFEDGDQTSGWRFPTKAFKNLKPTKIAGWFDLDGKTIRNAVISSVVPWADKQITLVLKKLGIKSIIFAEPCNIKGLTLKVNCAEVGADRIVNALAAWQIYGKKKQPLIIIDFGTATTFCAVTAKGEYLGGAISPGIQISVESLHEKTAKLPLVQLTVPIKKVISADTVGAMESGLYLGYISLVEGMIERMKKALGSGSHNVKDLKVIATGGYAPLIWQGTKVIDIIDPDLTLKGLFLIGNNQK